MFHDETNGKRLVLPTFLLGLLFCITAQAELTPGTPMDGSQAYHQYYTIDDTVASPQMEFDFSNPLHVISDSLKETIQAAKSNLNLLKWVLHKGEIGDPAEKYNRKKQFGTWINDQTDNTCLNTRHKVLERESNVDVRYKPNNNCVVDTGEWYDPYSGKIYTHASDLDIDHVVPLKNVYVNAAYSWSDKKRCLYANFTANDFHLVPVQNTENRLKGDKTPADYMPPNEAYACEYLENWLKIKLIWDIPMQPPEKDAIAQLIKENGCSINKMQISKSAFNKQRTLTSQLQYICN